MLRIGQRSEVIAPAFAGDCVFRRKSAGHSDLISAIASDAKSATDSDLMSATP
jgi:hypothetical protein